MKVYTDSDFKCHTSNPDGSFKEVKTNFFDNKCVRFIEGYRFIPEGESWTRPDGEVFHGEMIAPWKECAELDTDQRAYERALIADMQNALNKLGVTLNESLDTGCNGGL